MSLCSEIQGVLERTYSETGFKVEECIVGPDRCAELSAMAGDAWALQPHARTFLRWVHGDLHVAIYYSPELIQRLEAEPPHRILSHRNIGWFIAFIEEINHAVHAALAFHAGLFHPDSEKFKCSLETQAKVDTYWMLLRFASVIAGNPLPAHVRTWLFDRVFEDERFDYEKPHLAKRYRLANNIARRFVQHTESLPPKERITAIRAFRNASLIGKARIC